MFRDTQVYSVQHSNATDKWTVYVNGTAVVKSENPGAITGRYTYHEYDKKKDAVEAARKMAKKDNQRSQLKVFNKSGRDTTEVTNYGSSGETGRVL